MIMNRSKLKVMISACLMGINCRYDGTAKAAPELTEILRGMQHVPFCPEVLGGLKSPRPPAEIVGGTGADVLAGSARVLDRTGADKTGAFIKGARAVLDLAREIQPEFVILKANSPSCGTGMIYDGSFDGVLRDGDGVTAALLRSAGIRVYSERDLLEKTVRILGENKC